MRWFGVGCVLGTALTLSACAAEPRSSTVQLSPPGGRVPVPHPTSRTWIETDPTTGKKSHCAAGIPFAIDPKDAAGTFINNFGFSLKPHMTRREAAHEVQPGYTAAENIVVLRLWLDTGPSAAVAQLVKSDPSWPHASTDFPMHQFANMLGADLEAEGALNGNWIAVQTGARIEVANAVGNSQYRLKSAQAQLARANQRTTTSDDVLDLERFMANINYEADISVSPSAPEACTVAQ